MRNFTLPRGPCKFLNLRISPCEVLFLFLLSVFLLSSISPVPPAVLLLGPSPCLPPSAPSLGGGGGAQGSPSPCPPAQAGGYGTEAPVGDRRRRASARAREEPRRGGPAWIREARGAGDGVQGAAEALERAWCGGARAGEERQRHTRGAGQGRMRLGRAWMELRRGSSGRTRPGGSEATRGDGPPRVRRAAQHRRRLRSGGCGRIRTGAVGFLVGVNVLAGVRAGARRVAVEMDPVRAGFGSREDRGGECGMAQDQQPARLISASACACEATCHARAG
jgi:hypothetical protein